MDDDLKAALNGIGQMLTDRLASMEQRFDERLASMEQRLDARITDLRVVVMERFERMENRLTSVNEDMRVTMATASIGMQQREGDRRDLAVFTEAVTLIQRKVSRLQTDIEELQKKAS